jgi:hypothetical protein
MYVYPRLPEGAAHELLLQYADLDSSDLRKRAGAKHPDAAPVAVGGTPVPEEVIANVAESVRGLADELGFPEVLSRARVGEFDKPATALIHERMQIVPSDAASDEVWNFLTLVVLPDVAVWRWPGRAEERLLGRPRNAFRRLWWRAEVLGVELICGADGLGEDELVNIMERPTLSADERLAQCIAGAIVRSPKLSVARSELMRDFAKRVLRTQGAFCLDVLADEELVRVVRADLQAAISALTGTPPNAEEVEAVGHIDVAHPVRLDVRVRDWLAPYVHGVAYGKASPANCRFHPDSRLAGPYVTRYFERLIRAEAPVHVKTLFDAFARDWDVDPYLGKMPEALDRALRRCSIGGVRVTVSPDGFVRIPGKLMEQVRVPQDDDVRGPSEVPPEEIELAAAHLRREIPAATPEDLVAELSELFKWSSVEEARGIVGDIAL